MLEIELMNNMRGRIIGPDKLILKVDDFLAETDPRARFIKAYKDGRWDGKIRFIGAHGMFPLGLFPRIYVFCKHELDEEPKIYDNRTAPALSHPYIVPAQLGDKVLRDYQHIMASKSLYRKIAGVPFPRGIIAAATNAGKSLISAAICSSLREQDIDILFLCHKVEIFDQIVGWYGEYLDEDIGIYNSKKNDIRNVTVAMITTLYSRRKSAEVRAILKHFPALIVDEVHHASSKSWAHVINNSSAYYKFGLSGTAMKSEPHRNTTLRGLFGPIVAQISNKQLVDRHVSAIPNISMINYEEEDLSNDPEVSKLVAQETHIVKQMKAIESKQVPGTHSQLLDELEWDLREVRRKLYKEVFTKVICLSNNRADCISKIVAMHEGEQVLIIVSKLAHGRFLKDKLKKYKIESTFVNGKTPDAERKQIKDDFASGDIQVLIATLIYKEGVDLPSIDVLVIALGEKAPHSILQTFGRGLRRRKDKESVDIYDFNDGGHKTIEKHTRNRLKIYREEGFKPKYIEL